MDRAPAEAPFEIKEKDARTAVNFDVNIPAALTAGSFAIDAEAVVRGTSFTREMHSIEFPHIQTHRLYPLARATVRVLDLKSSSSHCVGYVMGSGDEVPEAIRQMGLPVTMLARGRAVDGRSLAL